MTANQPPSNVPFEIQQLNRLFLDFLRDRQSNEGDLLGLPGRVAALLADTAEDRLMALASYPQAMFRFEFDGLDSESGAPPGDPADTVDPDLAGLQTILLVSAWHLCRQNVYMARLYLRLGPSQVRRLAELSMSDLRAIAARHRIVRCAYLRLSWMWPELFRTAGADRRRLLILLGLQPSVALGGSALPNS